MRTPSSSRFSRPLAALAITLAAACADYEEPAEPNEGDEPGESLPNGDEASTNTSVTPVSQAMPDAGSPDAPDASVHVEKDAGTLVPSSDSGVAQPTRDAGVVRADAGTRAGDAGSQVDAGTTVDACAALSYANFGMQFMASYCVSCHSGTSAKHGVQLDTLSGVQKNKAAVKREAVTGTGMPSAGTKPSAADRVKLGQWLDCGAK